MPFTLTMPKLSPTMEQGTIVKWFKREGDQVKDGELLLEIATDKATVEYSALDGGWIKKILVQEGGDALINQAIAIFTEEKDESIEGYQPAGLLPAKKEAAKPQPQEEGKEAKETPQPRVAAIINVPEFYPEPPLEGYRFEFPTQALEGKVRASPLARRLAQERRLDLTSVKGSGPSGRIMSRDLKLARPQAFIPSRARTPTVAPGSYTLEPLTPMRKAIGQRLQGSKSSIPHFYVTIDVEAARLVALREELEALGVKVTFNDCVIRAVALALRDHPGINSGFDSKTNQVIRFQTIDISVAVSLPTGLITPILRHADFKQLAELNVEMKALATKAKEGKLQPHEYKGGSFTISNLGMFGISHFEAILNPPQAAILAVGAIRDLPVVAGGAVVPGKVMSLTLSVDHRVIDGVAAAQFLNRVKFLLERPSSLLL